MRPKGMPATIVAHDGVPLRATIYGSLQDAATVVVINSALGIVHEFYAMFASFLAARGHCVIAYDYRGNGLSSAGELRKVRAATISDWARQDFSAVLAYVAEHSPGARIFCVGHSVGGQLLGLIADNNRVRGLLAVASQVGYWRLWQGVERWKAWFTFHVAIPILVRVFGYYPGSRLGMCDLPAGVALEWARWCRSKHYITDDSGIPMRDGFSAYRGRALFISVYDDRQFAPRLAVQALCRYYRSAVSEHRHIESTDIGDRSVGHFGFFRKSQERTLWIPLANWLEASAAPSKE
ncbi:MAG TPA: alpha/beta fold hydrolase [Steroidobacteraceae bacterium]